MKTFIITLLLAFCSTSFAETVWIDLRGKRSYEKDHIEGHQRMKLSKLRKEIAANYPDKDTEIRLYCRSGVRSSVAVNKLTVDGYTNVINMGGIHDVREYLALSENTANPKPPEHTAL